MSPRLRHAMLVSAILLTGAAAGRAQVVEKVAESFEGGAWSASMYNVAKGAPALSDDVPAELRGASKHSMVQEVRFPGNGFAHYTAESVPKLVIPGKAQRLSLWVRGEGPEGYGWVMGFVDGWGRAEVNGKKLEWNLSKEVGPQWKRISFDVPADWVPPITINGTSTHNWHAQSTPATIKLWIDDLTIQTDIGDVDPQTGVLRSWKPGPPDKDGKVFELPRTPLLSVAVSSADKHNVFAGVKPALTVNARSWKPEAVTGKLEWKVLDASGEPVLQGSENLRVEATQAIAVPVEVEKYGLYELDATLAWSNGETIRRKMPIAYVPTPVALTDAEKDASPYGINVHGGRHRMVDTFSKAGIVWFRDYAFAMSWMIRAKGDDRKYAGWPFYPAIVQDYENAGVRLLACLNDGVQPPREGGAGPNGGIGPDMAWTRELVSILAAFPYIRHYELANEYDLPMKGFSKFEEPIAWKNYEAYHQKFAEVVDVIGGDEFVSVENGRAGIWPDLVAQAVDNGSFAKLDVVNSHHYTGVDPPETNVVNSNTGMASPDAEMLFFDQLRMTTAAGRRDGKQREHWITEFGWDTLAGPVVSPRHQAAYLQRAYMLILASGTDKGFWFFDLDAEVGKQFFDGCGLVTHELLPKLSLPAFAGMTQVLPKPEYVGSINAGPGTHGYVFRNGDDLVASLWTIDDVPGAGPSVTFDGAKLYDWMANPLAGSSAALGLAPVFAVGIDAKGPLYAQTAYEIATPHLISVASGDTVTATLRITNNRDTAIRGSANLRLPAGWTTDATPTFDVAPGQQVDVPLAFRVSPDQALGEDLVTIDVSEGKSVKAMPLRVRVRQPLAMKVSPLPGEAGTAKVTIDIANHSTGPLDGDVSIQLPTGWKAEPATLKVTAMAPKERRTLTTSVTWTPEWQPDEKAAVTFTTADGRTAEQPLIPGQIAIHRAGTLAIDGDLSDWSPASKLPAWALGSTRGEPNANVYLAWSEQGLYVAVEATQSKAQNTDPRAFWGGDCLELFLSTRSDAQPRPYQPGDHQFWVVPQVDTGGVYVGQWKRADEIAETRYDLKTTQGKSTRTGDGYVMECFIPASEIKGYQPSAGAKLGLNLNLTVTSPQGNREVYWTRSKDDGGAAEPHRWGAAVLGR